MIMYSTEVNLLRDWQTPQKNGALEVITIESPFL